MLCLPVVRCACRYIYGLEKMTAIKCSTILFAKYIYGYKHLREERFVAVTTTLKICCEFCLSIKKLHNKTKSNKTISKVSTDRIMLQRKKFLMSKYM